MKILVVEDDQDIIDIVSFILKDEGYEVIAFTHHLPIAEIEQLQPDLILLDEWLGKVKGSAICRQLKANASTSSIPVLMLSALTPIEKVVAEAGADGYIKKPFDISQLTQTISNFVNTDSETK